VGVRAVAGDRTGYAYAESISRQSLLQAAHTASRIASGGSGGMTAAIGERRFANCGASLQAWQEVTPDRKMPFIQRLNEQCFALDGRTVKVMAQQSDSTSYILFCNSEGVACAEVRPMASLAAYVVMESGGRIENNFASRSFRAGAEFLTDELADTLAREATGGAALMFEAAVPRGGEMPVVMAAGGSGILLHEAIGHAFEADFNRKNISIFSDKLGAKICDASINVVDDGTIPGNRGSVGFDDEGVAGRKTYIVREGVLASYLHDRISARHYGVQPTGNGRRESFRCAPMPRMRCTYMDNGAHTEEELIAAVTHGIYAQNFTNGQVQIGAGDFTFYVKQGYLIENGKLTRPIKDVNIIGNGPKALADISMVANNLQIDPGAWTCGKNGQSMPVSQGLPSVLVKKLTVGGE
jgi:TldD protein